MKVYTIIPARYASTRLPRRAPRRRMRLMPVEGTNALDGNALAFASGSTLDLQNAELVYIADGVTVDGVPVKGSANALRRAGMTVTGSGEIQIGPPQGTVILFR